jgi:YHS domain-containing protein
MKPASIAIALLFCSFTAFAHDKHAAPKAKKAATETAKSGELAPWEPVDPAFTSCQGTCSAHQVANDKAVPQPGAKVGDLTYCPVSGAVFEVKETSGKTDVDGKTYYFCCDNCAKQFMATRDEVLKKRHLAPAK